MHDLTERVFALLPALCQDDILFQSRIVSGSSSSSSHLFRPMTTRYALCLFQEEELVRWDAELPVISDTYPTGAYFRCSFSPSTIVGSIRGGNRAHRPQSTTFVWAVSMIRCRFANKEEERGKAAVSYTRLSSERGDINYIFLYELQLQRRRSFCGDGRNICDAPAQEGPVHKPSWMISATRQAVGRAKGVAHSAPASILGIISFRPFQLLKVLPPIHQDQHTNKPFGTACCRNYE